MFEFESGIYVYILRAAFEKHSAICSVEITNGSCMVYGKQGNCSEITLVCPEISSLCYVNGNC